MTNNLKIEFKLLIDGKDIGLDQFLNEPKKLLDYYIKQDRLTCCSFKGGFCIDINNTPWNGHIDPITNELSYRYEIDEFWMTATWLYAVSELLCGSTMAGFSPYEEGVGNLILKNEDDLYIAKTDTTDPKAPMVRSVAISFKNFCTQILSESRKFVELSQKLKEEIDLLDDTKHNLNSKIHEIKTNFLDTGYQEATKKLENLLYLPKS